MQYKSGLTFILTIIGAGGIYSYLYGGGIWSILFIFVGLSMLYFSEDTIENMIRTDDRVSSETPDHPLIISGHMRTKNTGFLSPIRGIFRCQIHYIFQLILSLAWEVWHLIHGKTEVYYKGCMYIGIYLMIGCLILGAVEHYYHLLIKKKRK